VVDNKTTSTVAGPFRKNPIARTIGIIISPRSTFNDIVKTPTWLFPFLLVTVVGVLWAYLKSDLIAQGQVDFMSKINIPSLPENQIQMMTEKSGNKWIWITPLYGTPFAFLGMTLLYWFSGNVVFGGKATFKMIFSIVSWSWVVSIIGWSVSCSIQLLRWDYTPPLSLAFLVPRESFQISFLYFLLSQIDLVYLWVVFIAGIGVSAVYKFSIMKGVSITVFWCIIYILMMATFDMLPFLLFGANK